MLMLVAVLDWWFREWGWLW